MNERYNFLDIFNKELVFDKDKKVKVCRIVIPKIQRPYAQGRLDDVCTYVRNTLLDKLFANFKTDKIFDFNFIYGVVRESNSEYVMELLDGQQRMTTLFLLYWYVANRELTQDDAEDTAIRKALWQFVYETRSSATVFCEKLAGYRIDMSSHSPSEIIKQAKWYFKSFNRDSTITAMLTMLDAIHKKYTEQMCTEILEKLDNIQFYVQSLGVFNLSEELYIKMNARGLQLSPFENFKADLTNFITESDFKAFKSNCPLYKNDSGEQVPFYFIFSVKLDAKWIDIFWHKGMENFDASYMSFFSRFFACKYIVSTKESVSDRNMRQDSVIRKIYTDAEDRKNRNEYLGFQEFETILNEHPSFIVAIDRVFDVFHEYGQEIFRNLLAAWDKKDSNDGDDFYCNAKSNMTHTKLIVFGSVIEFIDAYKSFDINIFRQWMRVVWNVVENTNIDSLTPVSSLIRKFSVLIHSVAERSTEGIPFYTALSMWKDDKTDERENRAVVEEVEKAKRISSDDRWLSIFTEAELHPFFKGMVLFFYQDSMTLEQYTHNFNIAKEMFDESGISPLYRENHLLIRAIVSQLNTWEDLNERYITERSEPNKYLKNILAVKQNVRNMLVDVLCNGNETSVKQSLTNYIATAKSFEPWSGASADEQEYCDMAFLRLCHDKQLYDWIAKEERDKKNVFRVYLFYGHISLAIPGRQYARVALDTERAKIANYISETFGFTYDDQNQSSMFKQYGDCFGKEIWLYQDREKCKVWIGFCMYHELCIQLECQTKKFAQEMLDKFADSGLCDNETRWVYLPSLEHFKKNETINDLRKVIDQILEFIPQKMQLL